MWKLMTIQQSAAVAITGAIRTTVADILDIHANILPALLQIQKIMTKTAIRLATLPSSHPLHHETKKATKEKNKHHKSIIDNLIEQYKINSKRTKTIQNHSHSMTRYQMEVWKKMCNRGKDSRHSTGRKGRHDTNKSIHRQVRDR